MFGSENMFERRALCGEYVAENGSGFIQLAKEAAI